jgi:hypothetical protein
MSEVRTAEPTDSSGGGVPAPAAESRGGEAGRWVQVEPGTVLPAQWYPNVVAGPSVVPEKRLLLAILEEAVATLQRYVLDDRRRGRRLYREAEKWVLSDDISWPCTFCNICDALGIDPVYLRHGVMRWSNRRRANPPTDNPCRYAFRRLGGSRTRAIGRPLGVGRYARVQDAIGS